MKYAFLIALFLNQSVYSSDDEQEPPAPLSSLSSPDETAPEDRAEIRKEDMGENSEEDQESDEEYQPWNDPNSIGHFGFGC